ncbi:MAG: hypothetical protein HXX13_08900 [Bacteroidetes bacterium]|nr:hypothetical protein [Bacteroidota bacterium]
MKFIRTLAVILLATIWISISEFARNQLLFKSYWVNHYQGMGLTFPEAPINGAVWGIWSMMFAISIYIISRKFSLLQTTFLSWFVGFVLMWLVLGNMGVLPYGLLIYAVPLSMLEAFFASLILKKLLKG